MNDSLAQKATELATEVIIKSKYGLMTALIIFVERYIFSDWPFLIFLTVLVVLDTALGFGYAFSISQVSARKFSGILVKIVVYGSVLVVGHVVENFSVSGLTIPGGVYFKITIYASVVVLEGLSIFRNLGKIDKDLVPKFLIKRFEGFNETGDFQALTGTQNSNLHSDENKRSGDQDPA
jgi:hypothetical protein